MQALISGTVSAKVTEQKYAHRLKEAQLELQNAKDQVQTLQLQLQDSRVSFFIISPFY